MTGSARVTECRTPVHAGSQGLSARSNDRLCARDGVSHSCACTPRSQGLSGGEGGGVAYPPRAVVRAPAKTLLVLKSKGSKVPSTVTNQGTCET